MLLRVYAACSTAHARQLNSQRTIFLRYLAEKRFPMDETERKSKVEAGKAQVARLRTPNRSHPRHCASPASKISQEKGTQEENRHGRKRNGEFFKRSHRIARTKRQRSNGRRSRISKRRISLTLRSRRKYSRTSTIRSSMQPLINNRVLRKTFQLK